MGLPLSSKLDGISYIISIAKTSFKKIGVLIWSMKFLSTEVAVFLNKSTIQTCMKYCFHVWAGTSSCYLNMLNKFQKRICWLVGPTFGASREPLGHCRNVASLSLFYRHCFGRSSNELAELIPLPYSRGRSIHYSPCPHGRSIRYSHRLHNLSPSLDVVRISTSTAPYLAQLDSGTLCLHNAFLWPII